MHRGVDPGRFGQAVRAVEALRETVAALGDRASLERTDLLLRELRRRAVQGAPVVPLSIARERRAAR